MTGPVFVDTNVHIYRFDASEPEKQRRCDAWLRHLWSERSGRLSIQVLQELYPNLTRKLDHPLSPGEARGIVRSLYAWDPVPVARNTIEAAWNLQDRHSLSWWDALIVAAAQAADCAYLLTEDLNHDQDLDGVRVVDPFQTEPDQL